MNKIICFLCALPAFASGFARSVPAQECKVTDVNIGGYVGDRIETCIEERVKKENVEELVDVFRHKDETRFWQTEFLGKWMQGAIASYQYTKDPELLELIRKTAEEFMETQTEDGYIGNYAPQAQLTNWDIWGRKYSALALIAYYRLTGEQKALDSCRRLIDHFINQLHGKNVNIALTGNYLGMASCSILEPVVYLYELTRQERFLDFAKEIVASINGKGAAQLITKALEDVPVSRRSGIPSVWFSSENGQKAYEMMSCYVGMIELGRVLGDPFYCEVAKHAAESIISDEINVAGSGSSFECWYGGKELQTVPAYHTMETCVTFTYMQFCSRLFRETGNSRYISEFERSMYNALFTAMKHDGSQIAKYSPLEGRKAAGGPQCGMHINCCNANGPRAFALIPQTALTTKDNVLFVNLFMPLDARVEVGKKGNVSLKMSTDFPVSGDVTIDVSSEKPQNFVLALRIPEYAAGAVARINGEETNVDHIGGYLYLDREWGKDDCVELNLKLETKVVTQNNAQALVRGPLVFARDSRFNDGDVDECLVILQRSDGTVNAEIKENDGFAWVSAQVTAVAGTHLEDPEILAGRPVKFCDFSSAGNDWDAEGRYRVWIPKTLYIMPGSFLVQFVDDLKGQD